MSTTPPAQSSAPKENKWAILVQSIGTAGVGLVKALKEVSPYSENKIAARLFQAPSHLLSDLPRELAEEMNELLLSAGLESQVIEKDAKVELGDADHEVALVIRDISRMDEIAQLIISLTGANIDEVRQILFTTPTVLLGKISKNTALKIRERFEPLDVEVDISNAHTASFDLFLGQCSEMDYQRIEKIFKEMDIDFLTQDGKLIVNSIIASNLSRTKADEIWQKVSRTSLPLRIVNRDFERFDLRLESLPNTREAIQYLTSSTGMPEKIAHKALENLPIVLQQNISFPDIQIHLEQINKLGGIATGNLLVFQAFSLQIESIKNPKRTIEIIKGLGRMPENQILSALEGNKRLTGPFTSLQARLLQHELKRVGTISKRILK